VKAAAFPEKSSSWPAASILAVLSAIAGSVLVTTSLQSSNTRILTSWHGFLHTAIANRFPGPFGTPENPFFAGEPLPYYWFHHYVASAIGVLMGVDSIHAFQILTISGLVLLWVGAVAIGVRHFGSTNVGLLIGFLVLAGVNPLGPVVAVGKNLIQGQQLIDHPQFSEDSDSGFVTNRQSDALMTQPLLGGLYVSGDWRRGQNITWYLDNSSRGIAVALILPLLYGFIGKGWSWGRVLLVFISAAAMTASSPLIGLAAVGSISGGAFVAALWSRFRSQGTRASIFAPLGLAAAASVGAVLASPTYYQLFLVGSSAAEAPSVKMMIAKALALVFNVIVLLPLAIWAIVRAKDELRYSCLILVIAACSLLAVVPFVRLPDGTEHNLANTAQTLLVVPAVAALAAKRRPRWIYAVLVGLFVPMTVASLVSYVGRPALPIAFEHGTLHRTSGEGLEQLYEWIRGATSDRAVFITDPGSPAKMSGNVAELPAFTKRTLFVDQPTYMTTPHKDFERRLAMANRLVKGSAMQAADASYLEGLKRPVYLVTYHADQTELQAQLTQMYGAPLFHKSFIAVYELTGKNGK